MIFTCIFAMAQSNTTDAGIIINGIKWATRNVGEPGTFVDNPEDFGNYYTWDEAQNVCPSGWRLPTKEELRIFYYVFFKDTVINEVKGQMLGEGKEIVVNGAIRRMFANNNNLIFLPAAGFFTVRKNNMYFREERGCYWGTDSYYYFTFGAIHGHIGDYESVREDSCSVRCVAE